MRATAPSRSPEGNLAGRRNATTLAVLLANRPKGMPEAEWLQLMAKPENATLFPLRVTQAMLDTLDGREMDLRYRYVLVEQEIAGEGGR